MKKTLYTFLVWNFLLFVAGLSDIVFYRNLTSVEGMTISWTQPALVSITSFLILLSIYYGMHQLLFGKNFYLKLETSVYKGYKQDKIEMRGDRAEMSDFPLYLNTVAGGLDRRDQTIGGFSFVVKIYAVPVVEIIG